MTATFKTGQLVWLQGALYEILHSDADRYSLRVVADRLPASGDRVVSFPVYWQDEMQHALRRPQPAADEG